MPREIATKTMALQASGILPPGGAMPISKVLASPASSMHETNGAAPTPSTSPVLLPHWVLSSTATTSSLRYRITLHAVFAVCGSLWPSVKMIVRRLKSLGPFAKGERCGILQIGWIASERENNGISRAVSWGNQTTSRIGNRIATQRGILDQRRI